MGTIMGTNLCTGTLCKIQNRFFHRITKILVWSQNKIAVVVLQKNRSDMGSKILFLLQHEITIVRNQSLIKLDFYSLNASYLILGHCHGRQLPIFCCIMRTVKILITLILTWNEIIAFWRD